MTTTIESIKALHTEKLATMVNFPDGTYDVETLNVVWFRGGYQVTFCQEGDNYNDDDYLFLVEAFKALSSDGTVYCGVFNNHPEISFHFSDKEKALEMARKFNQVSVWDWSINDEILTGGTGKR